MKRRRYTLSVLVALLPCIGVLGLWASSYGYPFRWRGTSSSGATWFLGSGPGSLLLSRQAAVETPAAGTLSFETSRFGVVAVRNKFGLVGLSNVDTAWTTQTVAGMTIMVPPRTHHFAGFSLTRQRDALPTGTSPPASVAYTSLTTVGLDYPLLFLAAAALPAAIAWRAWRRRVRADRAGNCRVCGYDLRASPGRCPECGTASPVMTGVAE
jgi:hypothetical protein